MSDLSDDELTVLTLAAQGAPIIPIGRWKAPAEKLIRLGYLQPTPSTGDPSGEFNLRITESGNRAVHQHHHNEARDSLGVVEAQHDLAAQGERIARELSQMALKSTMVKPATKKEALREWSRVILERALELIGE